LLSHAYIKINRNWCPYWTILSWRIEYSQLKIMSRSILKLTNLKDLRLWVWDTGMELHVSVFIVPLRSDKKSILESNETLTLFSSCFLSSFFWQQNKFMHLNYKWAGFLGENQSGVNKLTWEKIESCALAFLARQSAPTLFKRRIKDMEKREKLYFKVLKSSNSEIKAGHSSSVSKSWVNSLQNVSKIMSKIHRNVRDRIAQRRTSNSVWREDKHCRRLFNPRLEKRRPEPTIHPIPLREDLFSSCYFFQLRRFCFSQCILFFVTSISFTDIKSDTRIGTLKLRQHYVRSSEWKHKHNSNDELWKMNLHDASNLNFLCLILLRLVRVLYFPTTKTRNR